MSFNSIENHFAMITENKARGQESASRPLEHELDIASATVLRGSASLRQLRDRVQALVRELDRLRGENQELMEKIAELQTSRKKNSRTTTLTFEKDREQLLAQINTFIKAIDSYLTTEDEKPES